MSIYIEANPKPFSLPALISASNEICEKVGFFSGKDKTITEDRIPLGGRGGGGGGGGGHVPPENCENYNANRVIIEHANGYFSTCSSDLIQAKHEKHLSL